MMNRAPVPMFERSGALIEKKFFEYLPPALFTMASLMIATVLNTVIIGNFLGEAALSVTGLTTPIIYFVNAFYFLFTYGGVTAASARRASAAAHEGERGKEGDAQGEDR